MSSPPTSTPNGDFQARLDRMAEARAPIEASKPVVSPIPDWKENIRYPAAMPVTTATLVVSISGLLLIALIG